MRKTKQVVALLLATSMSVSLLSTEALAARGNSKQDILMEEQQDELTDKFKWTETGSGGQWVTDESNEWDTFDLPDIIEKEEADEKGYIGRVLESEKDLHTFVFENSDGTNTMRVYELSHQFGAKDHYHDVVDGKCRNEDICTECKPNQRPEECIMYDPEYDKICAYCMKDIINHLNEHHKK